MVLASVLCHNSSVKSMVWDPMALGDRSRLAISVLVLKRMAIFVISRFCVCVIVCGSAISIYIRYIYTYYMWHGSEDKSDKSLRCGELELSR